MRKSDTVDGYQSVKPSEGLSERPRQRHRVRDQGRDTDTFFDTLDDIMTYLELT